MVHVLIDVQRHRLHHIQTDVVGQFERSHRMPGARLHGMVDVGDGAGAHLQQANGAEHVGRQQPIDDETGGILNGDRILAELLAELVQSADGVVRGLEGVDDLDQLHHRGRVEEMQAGHPRPMLADRHQRRHRQRGRVGGQQRLRRHDALQATEQGLLGLQILDDRLDDQIATGDIFFLGRELQQAERGVLVLGGHLAALDHLAERLFQPRTNLVGRARRRLDGDRRDTGLRAHLRHAQTHRTTAHDTDFLDFHRVTLMVDTDTWVSGF